MLGLTRRLVVVVGGMALVLFALMLCSERSQGVACRDGPDGSMLISCEQGMTATWELCLLARRHAALQAVVGHLERDIYRVNFDRREGILVCWDASPAPSGQGGGGHGCQQMTLDGELVA